MANNRGGRQYIHILLDPVTYLKVKASGENMSELGNRLFNQYFELTEKEIPEEIELVEQITNLSKIIKEAQEKLSQYSVMLSKVRKDKEVAEKEHHDQSIAMYDAIRKTDKFHEGGW